jgi:DNA-binding NtrC family response regulator
MENILDVLEISGFNSIPCLTEDDALKCITLTNFDIVLIDRKVNRNSQKNVRENLNRLYPQIPVLVCDSPYQNLTEEIKNTLNL